MAQQLNWEKKDSLEDVKIILAKILRRWYWVVGVLMIALISAFLYIRYQDPVYVVKASFISRKFDDRGENVVPSLTGFGSFSERIEVNQQIPLLKSESRIYETLDRLNFGVSYFVEGRLKTTELYGSVPYTVEIKDSSNNIPYNKEIYLQLVSEDKYTLSTGDEVLNRKFKNNTFLFDRVQNINGWEFEIKHSKGNGISKDYGYFFIIHDPKSIMNQYRNKLTLAWAFRESAILNATINSELPEKDFDFLRAYLDVVIDFGLDEKREYLANSVIFIDRYMNEISDTLVFYQNKIDQFRLSNREVISGSTLVIDKLNILEEEKASLILEASYLDHLQEYIKKQKSEEVFAPNLIGLEVPPLQELIVNYMEVKWQDQIRKNELNDKNPLVIRENEEFERLELNIYESIRNQKELNAQKENEIDKQINFYLKSISDLHVEYRDYLSMERMESIYEQLYNQLLARKTDANISMASVTSDYQMVTEPQNSKIPIYPNKDKSYIIALLVGLGLPIGLILLFDFLNPKVISKEDLKRHTNIPIIGSVGHFKGKTNLVVSERPKSQVAESFRVMRANIEYVSSEHDESKIILITSSISGEGKTFCSINLAFTYANMGKRTLLIGADMRRPALARSFGLERKHGLSNYLSGQDQIEDIIHASKSDQLHVIPGGHVPPNPAELLTSNKMTLLMDRVKKEYEVIIFDTPPIGLVSDTVELIKHSFTPLLVVRQDVTYKKSLDAITEMYQIGKYKNLGIIMNDVNYMKYDYGAYYGRSYGYGSGYGYGYYDDEKKPLGFLKRLFRSQGD